MEASEGEEEAWLVAMEKGQLDDRGYIPRRPGAALTARQVSDHTPFPAIILCACSESYAGLWRWAIAGAATG